MIHGRRRRANRSESLGGRFVSMWISPAFASRMGQRAGARTRRRRMSDAEYLIERAHQELNAAISAQNLRVRQVHLELADAYTSRLYELKRAERKREIVRQAIPRRRRKARR